MQRILEKIFCFFLFHFYGNISLQKKNICILMKAYLLFLSQKKFGCKVVFYILCLQKIYSILNLERVQFNIKCMCKMRGNCFCAGGYKTFNAFMLLHCMSDPYSSTRHNIVKFILFVRLEC